MDIFTTHGWGKIVAVQGENIVIQYPNGSKWETSAARAIDYHLSHPNAADAGQLEKDEDWLKESFS